MDETTEPFEANARRALSAHDGGAVAVTLFMLAGRLTSAIPWFDEEQRRWARDRRGLLVQRAAQILAEALGSRSAYEMAGAEKGAANRMSAETRTWLVCHLSPWHTEPADEAQEQRQTALLARALALLQSTASASDARGRDIASTLVRCVIRPLCETAFAVPASEEAADTLAKAICSAAFSAPIPCGGIEAALVDLALHLVNLKGSRREAACGVLRLIGSGPLRGDPRVLAGTEALSRLPPSVNVLPDGPYVFEGAAEVVNHLGVPAKVGALAAFCRCGKSASKPFCDGSHAASSFSGDKDVRRVADRCDAYLGQQATVFDNRGLCAHSGLCTDRLNSVFHLGEEPFVTPSGARLDDIMSAVRRCPSGALSLGFSDGESRRYVDESRPARIEISKDGPYRITGSISVLAADNSPIPRQVGASEEHYSLCRCGSSLNKPFCSGMHWSVAFADPRPDPNAEPTLFEWAGGYPAILDTTRIFYSRHVPSDPLVGPLFATMAPDHPERVAAWLSEVFGGPKFYSERYGGYTHMISQHLNKHLTKEQRARWAMLMVRSADEAGLPDDPEFRAAFTGYIEWGSRIAFENSQRDAQPPPNMPIPQWWWVCNAIPGARPSAIASKMLAAEVVTPVLAPEENLGFAAHIKDLFRAMDRSAMKFAFDLGSYDDVRAHADAILARVRAGTMPCDKAWPPERVALFERWIKEGAPK